MKKEEGGKSVDVDATAEAVSKGELITANCWIKQESVNRRIFKSTEYFADLFYHPSKNQDQDQELELTPEPRTGTRTRTDNWNCDHKSIRTGPTTARKPESIQ